MVDHLDLKMSYAQLVRLIRDQTTALIQRSGIGSAGLRVHSGGFITIENGGLEVEGTATVSGLLTGNGTFDWWGPSILRGTVNITGDLYTSGQLGVSGPTVLGGPVTMNNTLTLGATGQITAGTVVINRFGSYGGQIVSTGTVLYLGAGQTVIVGAEYLSTNKISATDVECFTLDVLGSKNFKMPHPLKPDTHWLRHGSTESPVSGTEYTGRVTLDASGEGVIELPDYFEALNKPEGRTVQLTPVGRPFPVGADDVVDGKVTVYGDPGREVFWLVKAERVGGDFLLEEEITAEADTEPPSVDMPEPESSETPEADPFSIWRQPQVHRAEE
jgi:hypothetical protein